jgi:4-hydroxy-tetrahydrodipicolinate synthase
MFKPEGIIPAMITPFHEDETIHEEALRQQVRRFIEAGVDGLFCLGTNGEFFALSFEEKLRVAEIIVEEAAGQLPVYAGTGCTSTWETMALNKQMERIGVSALSVITPFFLTFTQAELTEHYRRVAESTPLPIVLYNIPARTGNSLQAKTVAELSKIPNIVGIKDSSGSFDTILQYISHTDSDFAVLAGTDSLILPTLMAGGKGAIAATANLLPRVVSDIYQCWKNQQFEQAAAAQNELSGLRNAFGLGTLPSVLKEAMNMAGLAAGQPRMPVRPLSEPGKQELAAVIQAYREKGLLT